MRAAYALALDALPGGRKGVIRIYVRGSSRSAADVKGGRKGVIRADVKGSFANGIRLAP